MEGYDVAQICRAGHVITAFAQTSPEFKRDFCSECGSPTITACEHCHAEIRGTYHVPGFFGFSELELPKYCHACGKPYPWQASGTTRRGS